MCIDSCVLVFFLFKQKTAYEMRISDWSSDVCSSDLMPATLYYSHRILEKLALDRHTKAVDFLEPDAKSQVTLAYENEMPVRATALVVSTQHSKGADQGKLRDYVKSVMNEVLPQG